VLHFGLDFQRSVPVPKRTGRSAVYACPFRVASCQLADIEGHSATSVADGRLFRDTVAMCDGTCPGET